MIINPDQRLSVTLHWGGDIDLDLTAFMLGQNALVIDDGGVVFYNSLTRDEAYDESVHGDHQQWRRLTRPMSPDGAVIGAADASGAEGLSSQEAVTIDLSRIEPDVKSVMLCVTSCVKDGRRPPIVEAERPHLLVADKDNRQLGRYDLSQLYGNACGYEALELVRRHDGRWSLEEADEFHEGGLVELLEKFV